MSAKVKPNADCLVEVSWEVCNKVGGIYTVLISKAAQLVNYYRDNYYLVGPFFTDKAKGEFQEEVPPDDWKGIFNALETEGIKCHYGKWLIEGEPAVILIDFINLWGQADAIKGALWDSFRIDSLGAGYDFTEPVVWGWAVGKLLEQLAKSNSERKIVAQFHEWLSGAGLIYLKRQQVPVATVFTTHATLLGRTLANSNVPLYAELKNLNAYTEAYEHHVADKHQMETVLAHESNVFSTVSAITGLEAEYLLGKKPDIILPNGLDLAKFPTFEEAAIKHNIERTRIREFIIYYFFPYYTFDITETLLYFTVGRYEMHNKGIDCFIQSLAALNEQLKKEGSRKTVVAFIWVPTQIRGIKPEIIEAREGYRDIKDSLEEVIEELKENILDSLMAGETVTQGNLFSHDKEFLRELKRKVMKIKRKGIPPICTHDLIDPNDAIIKMCEGMGLLNREEDRVKIIYYPLYLTSSDGLLNLSYYESITGAHLGVFASFYEPWGYTPLETAALGVASVTSDLSGFGRYLQDEVKDKHEPGIFVLKRLNKTDAEVVNNLTSILHTYAGYSRRERIENKIQARKLAALCDWQVLVDNYIQAHNQALERAYGG